jgi:ABC-type molybdate transport system substrate-binding protein
VVYGHQRIAIWTKPGIDPPKDLFGLVDPKWKKIVLGYSPYGMRARRLLEKAGKLESIKDRLVVPVNGDDAFKQADDADVAVLSLPTAVEKQQGNYVEVDAEHSTVEALVVTCQRFGPTARKEAAGFLTFVASEPSRAVLRRHGFF